jgi:hypothetical protein
MTFVIFLLVCCPSCMLQLFYWHNVYVLGLPYKKERGDRVESLGRGGVSCELSIHRLLCLLVSIGIGKRTKHLHWMTEKYIIIYRACLVAPKIPNFSRFSVTSNL